MLQVLHQVDPAGVRLELGIAGLRVDVAAHSVQRRDTNVAATGDVDRRQVQRQTEQVVAQRLGDELVDLVTGLAGDPTHDGAGGILGGNATGGIRQRVEERRDQAQLLVGVGAGRVADDGEVDVEAVDGLGQHRVAEAVHGVGEFGHDRRIEVDVIHLGRGEEQVDPRLHGSGELLEHQVLVLHLGTELGGLEQPLAIPHQCVDCGLVGRQHGYRVEQPLVDEGQVTRIKHGVHGLRHQPVVLGVEDRMHGGQADVLVDPAIAGDVVRIEQFVVVGQVGAGVWVHRHGVAHIGIDIRHQHATAEHRHGIVGDVGKELVTGAYGVGQADGRVAVAFDQLGHVVGGAGDAISAIVHAHHHLRHAGRSAQEVAVGVGGEQRHVVDVGIGEVDAEHVASLGLDHLPGRHATDFGIVRGTVPAICTQVTVGDQAAGGDRCTVDYHVGAQEHLVRGVRAVGLVLVHEWRGGVGVLVNVVGVAEYAIRPRQVGGTGHHHEVGGATFHEQRIIRLQRDEDGARAPLGNQVQAMVEELPEEGHPGVERRRQASIGGGVLEQVHIVVVAGAELAVQARAGDDAHTVLEHVVVALDAEVEHAVRTRVIRGGIGRRVVGSLVDDQVADGARLRVEHRAAGLLVRRARNGRRARAEEAGRCTFGRVEYRVGQAREDVVGSTELGVVGAVEVHQVVVRAIHRPQAQRRTDVGQQREDVCPVGVGLGDLDLVEDEVEVGAHHVQAGTACSGIRHRRGRRRYHRRTRLHHGGGLGEQHFGGAVGVLVDRLDPQGQPGQVWRHLERGAVGALERQVAGRQQDDVLEHATARLGLELPVVRHRAVGERAQRVAGADVVGIQHAGHVYRKDIANSNRTAVAVSNGRAAGRLRIQPFHQHPLAVGELQALDVQQGIDAIAAVHGIGHRPHIVAGICGAAGVLGDHVLILHAGEHSSVEGFATGRGARQDFPHGLELAWVVGAVEHERNHVDHAVEAGDLGAGVVDVSRGIHGDAHVEPLVTVDEVIAPTAFDQVAAVAAEHDVAGGKAGGWQPGIGQELLQATDQRHVGQRTAGGTAVVEDGHGIDIIALEHIGEVRAGHALDLGKAVEDGSRRGADRVENTGVLVRCVAMGLSQGGQGQVDGDANLVILVGNPVEAGHAVHLVLGVAADKDVVAALADHLVEATATDENVVADHFVTQQRRKVVAGRTVLGALLDPVVTLVAGRWQVGLGAEDEVVALAAEGGADVFGGDDEVLAVATQDQVTAHQHAAGDDHVVAVVAFQAVVAERVGDDVVTGAAQYGIVAGAAFQGVVAGVAVDGIVALTGDDDVVAGGAAQHNVVFTGVVQVVGVWPGIGGIDGIGVVADHQRHHFDAVDHDAASRVGPAVGAQAGELLGLVHLQGEGGREEHGVGQVGDIGVEHDQLGEGVVLQLGAEVHARGARQVVEPVAVLQGLQLGFEDEVEAGAEHAAEWHFLLGQAADPEVDVIDTGHGHSGDVIGGAGDAVHADQCHVGVGAGAVEEVQAVRWCAVTAKHQRHGGGALGRFGVRPGDGGVGTVGGDEVDQRRRVLEMVGKVGPADVRLELAVAGHRIEIAPRLVEGGDAGVTATGNVQRGQVQRQAKQVVAQRLCDELVDFVAQLTGDATDDRAGRFVGGSATASEGQRVEEGSDQAELRVAVHRGERRVEAVDGLCQHRVTEAVNHMGELGEDGRVDRGVVAVGGQELVDLRLDGAGELFEHQVLVLHLGAELGSLEQPLAVPYQRGDFGGRGGDGSDIIDQPLVEERQVAGSQQGVLGLLHQAVVLGVEHMVHGSQADVLVHPAVAGDVVGVEQFVVVGQVVATRPHLLCIADGSVGVGLQHTVHDHRRGVVGDVIEEAMPGAHGIGQADRRGAVAFDQRGDVVGGAGDVVGAIAHAHHHLRHAVGPAHEVAVGVGGQQWHAVHIGVGQVDTEQVAGLGLDHCPGGHATAFAIAIVGGAEAAIGAQVTVGDQPPGGYRVACGIERVFPQEHLVRGVRAVGLALVDERRSGVGLAIVGGTHNTIGAGSAHGARQHHEVRRAFHEQRVVRLQRDEHEVGAALGDQVQTVVEELTEEGHPGVEASGQADVGRHVGDEEHFRVVSGAEHPVDAGADHRSGTTIGLDRGRVVRRLVDDQVADGAWLRIGDRAGAGIVAAEGGAEQAQERVVGGTELALPGYQVVVAAVHGAQAERYLAVGQQVGQARAIGVGFGDENLLKDELQVRLAEICHFNCPRSVRR
ncbi:hypothetical protein D3C81_567880 [compost metagenome]